MESPIPIPASDRDLQTLWAHYNEQYFSGTLPPIPIIWSARLTSSVGMFVSRAGPRCPPDRVAAVGTERRCIRLSSKLLKQAGREREIALTLAHEMIHQWQYDVLKRRPNHGADFRRMMDRMNEDGLGVTLYHSLGRDVEALARYVWRCEHCGHLYRRQRRTIRPNMHYCGACQGPLSELPFARLERAETERAGPRLITQLDLPFAAP
ncbi:MAG: SprT-like domain-containing protein [Nitrospiraceae bacterium]|nr:SprT-like domain-containing protein [Nitrospiraceae bacterium]